MSRQAPAASLCLGRSRRFRETVWRAELFAASRWPILLQGETGVGKEVLARHVHDRSPRGRAAFVPVNCGALPPALFESEIFGHERGAFSGAVQPARGLIRIAEGGTLFLDEIGELEPSLQAKLLRFLESGEVRSVGSTRIDTVDTRVIAATNLPLQEAVADGRFRLDLFQRLSVLRLRVPPLRERPEDVPPLASHLLEEMGAAAEPEALVRLKEERWPGNVRQLRNVLARAAVLSGGRITAAVLEAVLEEEREETALLQSEQGVLSGTLADIEKRAIVERLKACHGNRKQAARELGIAKSTLHDKLRKWRETPSVPAPCDPHHDRDRYNGLGLVRPPCVDL